MFVPIFKEFLTFLRRIFKERFWKDGMLKLREDGERLCNRTAPTQFDKRISNRDVNRKELSDLFNQSKYTRELRLYARQSIPPSKC